jgi:hypothetical protein
MTDNKDLRLFLNRLKCLRFIDADEFEQKVIDGIPSVNVRKSWGAFRDDPIMWFMRADDDRQAALWTIMTAQYRGDGV